MQIYFEDKVLSCCSIQGELTFRISNVIATTETPLISETKKILTTED